VNESEAAVVQKAFELLLQHRSIAAVTRALNDEGLFPKLLRPGGPCRQWDADAVAKLLRNPLYAGFMRYHGERHDGEHEAIVEPSTFDAAQAVLHEIGHDKASFGRSPQYILAELLYCGLCGKKMCAASTRKAGREYRYYRCTTRNLRGAEACPAAQLPAATIEHYVRDQVATAVRSAGLEARVGDAAHRKLTNRRAALNRERKDMPGAMAAAATKVSRLTTALAAADSAAGSATRDKLNDATTVLARLQRKSMEIDSASAALESSKLDPKWVASTLAKFDEVWEVLSPANKQRLLRALVERVEVDEPTGAVRVRFANLAGPPLPSAAQVS
jgi:hypothetical protein